MNDNAAWLAFKDHLQAHYQTLEKYHRELGGDYEDSSSSLMSVLQAALEASLEATKAECLRVREDCESMLCDMAAMRTAMGETSKSCSDDPFASFDPQTRIKTPLLDTQKVLRIEHNAAKKSFEERAAKVVDMYKKLEHFGTILPSSIVGVAIPLIDDANPPNDVSLLKLGQLDAACARCSQEILRRKKQVQLYGREIVQLWAELATETSSLDSSLERAIILDSQSKPESVGLSDETLAQLEIIKANLLQDRNDRRTKIHGFLSIIKSLYKKLRLSEGDLALFTSRVRGVADPIIRLCETELERLQELKKDHIEDFIKDARESLSILWDSLYLNDDDRLDFTPAYTDVFTDASLQAHENEIEKLQERLCNMEPLLSLLRRHMELDKEREDLEVQTSDPARFSKRGYNPMAESKLRARIENTMPRIEAQLREALQKYEEENLVPFRVWGELYLCDEVGTRKPISRLEPGQSRSVPLRDSLTRPKTGELHKPRPRTPGVAGRPATTSTPLRSGRAISTPTQHSGSFDLTSRSPTKRTLSHNHAPINSAHSSALRERPNTNITKMPVKIRPVSTTKSRSNSITRTSSTRMDVQSGNKSSRIATTHISNMPPPRIQRQIAPSMTRVVSGSSTSSHLSTKNWDAYQPTSEDEDEPPAEKPTDLVYHKTSNNNKHHFEPSASTGSHNGLNDSLQNVPEETSFVDDWGEEGF